MEKETSKIDINKIEIKEMRFTNFKRYSILFLIMLIGLVALLSITIILTSLKSIQDDLQVNSTSLDLLISAGLVISAIMPLFWGSYSDEYGRKKFYILCLLFILLGSIGMSISNNIWQLILFRMLQLTGSCSAFVLAYGVIGDIFEREIRGTAVGIFLIGPTIAPAVGPLLGGIINTLYGWRMCFWLISILSIILLILVIIILPETINKKIELPIKNKKINKNFKFINPFSPFKLLRFSNVNLVLINACLSYIPQLCSTAILAIILPKVYEINPLQLGLVYISTGVGDTIGSILGGKLSDYYLNKTYKETGEVILEKRLRGLWLGLILMILGLGLNGWFIHFKLPIWSILITQFITGIATMISISGTTTYLADLYPDKAASTYAIGSFAKHGSASIVVMFDSILLDLLGVGGIYSVFALANLLGMIPLLLMELYGTNLRKGKGFK